MAQKIIQLPRIGRHSFQEIDNPEVFQRQQLEYYTAVSPANVIEVAFGRAINPGQQSISKERIPIIFHKRNRRILALLKEQYIDENDPDIDCKGSTPCIEFTCANYDAVDRVVMGYNSWISVMEGHIQRTHDLMQELH